MRQLTTFRDAATAQKFTAWLITQRIDAHAEHEKTQEGDQWAVWIRDEDSLQAARHELKLFEADPKHARYQGAERQAIALREEELRRRERVQRNMVDVNRQWAKTNSARNTPLVSVMIVICIVVGVLTNLGHSEDIRLIAGLQFCDGKIALSQKELPDFQRVTPVWRNIQEGEVWRLVTPIFLHFSMMHIIFNLLAFYDFGGQVERQIKWPRMLLFVIIVAVISNVIQVVASSWWEGTSLFPMVGNFGGMSGVLFGLFGFVYIRALVQHDSRYILRPGTAGFAFVWLIGCIVWNFIPRDIVGQDAPFIANGAHVGGILTGMALAYVPGVFDQPSGQSQAKPPIQGS
jgi:GlpG protein